MKQTKLQKYTQLAQKGTKKSIKKIMKNLTTNTPIAETKIIDYALSRIENPEGIQTMQHYLFQGTQIQRNYATLYFLRKEEYTLIQEAYEQGLIDARQAFSR